MENDHFKKELDKAVARANEADKTEPRAKNAFYDSQKRRIVVEMENGSTFLFPPELAQGLESASKDQLADVAVTPSGSGLHFEALDAHFSLASLLLGVFGTKKWMAELGKRGGSASTRAKRRASRENGKKGGRPPKDRAA